MKLYVAFLWHMHQPFYLDPHRDVFIMPWVRLHAVKAYTDMVRCLDHVPEARVTFNLVPSLLYQIEEYNRGKCDTFWELTDKPAAELTPPEQDFLLLHFFSCHWPTMVEPYPRYKELLSKRGREISHTRLQAIRDDFNSQDFLDLQVWFNLTWVGFASRSHPVVAALLDKGRGFNEEEKQSLLDVHRQLISNVIPEYVRRWERGQIEISTTPFYHPILPLIYDTDLAKRCMPGVRLPRRFSYPQDASAHLEQAAEYCKKSLGRAPRGLWPSEGGVAPEIVPLMAKSGFQWAATDEAILFGSLDTHHPHDLFQPYRVEVEGGAINMVFRHHDLSDLIGFVYYKNPSADGIADFLSRLKSIRSSLKGMDRPPIVAVVLDGENPWEYYGDGGESLLKGIYQGILADPDMELVTIGNYLDEFPPTRTLHQLYTGSWINHDFGIWIGGGEENRAWEELGQARAALERVEKEGGEEAKARCDQARPFIFAAEGSDWFWWYGEQFVTDYAFEFDHLFRAYLQKVYRSLGLPVPERLLTPIRETKPLRPLDEPARFINPVIDGLISSYWEWVGAGTVPLQELGGAMHFGTGRISRIVYGFNLDELYVRLDPWEKNGFDTWEPGLHLRLEIKAGEKLVIDLMLLKDENTINWKASIESEGASRRDLNIRCAVKEIAEIAVPFSAVGALPGDELTFSLEIRADGLVQERWPRKGDIVLRVPDEDFERKHWLV